MRSTLLNEYIWFFSSYNHFIRLLTAFENYKWLIWPVRKHPHIVTYGHTHVHVSRHMKMCTFTYRDTWRLGPYGVSVLSRACREAVWRWQMALEVRRAAPTAITVLTARQIPSPDPLWAKVRSLDKAPSKKPASTAGSSCHLNTVC